MNRRTQQEMEEIEEQEEVDYVNASRGAVDTKRTRPGSWFLFFTQNILLIAVCWLILLAIMGLRIYFDTLSHESGPIQFKENSTLLATNTKLFLTLILESDPNQLKENSTLLAINTKLSLENTNLTRDNKNLTDQLDNLTQAYNVSESNNKNLSAGVKELETKNNILTEKIQNMETNWNELNVSRAQWSFDAYCKQPGKDKCQPCQKGWEHTEPSCCLYNNPPSPGWITWEEAREDCSGKNSDLAVAHNLDEKEAIKEKSFGSEGFWIGLRVVNKQWKWVDGSNLTDSSWIDPPDPVDGRCAVFYKGKDTWSAVSCSDYKQWICQQKALSV